MKGFIIFILHISSTLFIGSNSGILAQSLNQDYISENQYKIDIIKYDLLIDISVPDKKITAEIKIAGLITDDSLTSIDLNFYDQLHITGLLLNGNEANYIHKKNSLSISDIDLLNDTFNLQINYEGKPKSFGPVGFVFGEVNKRSLVYTLNQPDYASTWFPCNDIPSDKAMLEIKIRNTKENISVSNGKLIEVIEDETHKTYHWETYYPISTYLISIYSAPYEYFNDNFILNDDTL
ncbi:MAG: hypothetical protein R6W68_02045, partial [Ignavibacteriaceae bacterium]